MHSSGYISFKPSTLDEKVKVLNNAISPGTNPKGSLMEGIIQKSHSEITSLDLKFLTGKKHLNYFSYK